MILLRYTIAILTQKYSIYLKKGVTLPIIYKKSMKRAISAFALTFIVSTAVAQVSQNAYNFLRLPVSAHAAALGGDNITIIDDDASLMFHNPALLSSVAPRPWGSTT